MANYAGTGGVGGSHTGPYWRRQLGTTLPGERTGPQLAALNALRARMGLEPEGGPAQRHAIHSPVEGPGDLDPIERPGIDPGYDHLVPLPHPIDNTGGMPAFPGPGGLGDLRSQLLQQFQQHTAEPAGSGDPRQQLIQRLLQRQQRVAFPAGRGRPVAPAHGRGGRPQMPLRSALPA